MVKGHKYVGWREVKGWTCIRCGECCKKFLVDLAPGEAVYYRIKYGPVVLFYRGKYYLLKKVDGSCIFLKENGIATCTIYHDRPRVCRIYPFYVRVKPLKGDGEDAVYNIGGRKLYVYIDANCPGVNTANNILQLLPNVVRLWMRLFRDKFTES